MVTGSGIYLKEAENSDEEPRFTKYTTLRQSEPVMRLVKDTIYAMVYYFAPQRTIDFAISASVLKLGHESARFQCGQRKKIF